MTLSFFRKSTIFSLLFSPFLQAEEKPNILFIVCDDLNTHIAPSGYSPIITPHLSDFEKESMNFQRAYCQYPVCGPSRASMLHGLYPDSTGVVDNKSDVRETRPDSISLPQNFKNQGYWTGSVGKVFHSKKHEHGEVAWDELHRFENDELPVVVEAHKKFEAEHGSIELKENRKVWKELKKKILSGLNTQNPPGYGPSGLTDTQHKDGKNAAKVVEWLENKPNGKKPFFIACGIQKPHVPFLAPDKYFDLYPLDEIVYELDDPNLWDTLPKKALNKRYKGFGFEELGKENEPLRRKYTQAYHACVSFIDVQIGQILQSIKDQGLWDNTIIILTSDHGYHLGDHFMWGKVSLFDICTRVPFMVHAPGITKAGSKSEAMVELIDIYPTLTDLAKINAPSDLQGHSLKPLLTDSSVKGEREFTYSVVSRGKELGYAIRNQKWRYGKWPDGEELYDLTKDPHERKNLANDSQYRDRLKDLGKILDQKRAEAASRRTKS